MLDKFFKNNNTQYSPLLFLASLWAWWTSVMFFMYLMFLTNHTDLPIPTFDSLKIYFTNFDIIFVLLIIFSAVWILFFAFLHFKLLFWNLSKLKEFKKTKEYEKLKSWNWEVTLMALPLTLAMTLNVSFIIGAVFIPWLWWIVEFLFPFALLWFFLIWILALKIFSEYFIRLIVKWDFDFVSNNNLSQMMAIFAFSMIWVWFAAPAAMSQNLWSSTIWFIFFIFFITIAVFFAILKIIFWFKSIFEHGLSREASPSIWILIPILTLIWISFVRQSHSLENNFDLSHNSTTFFVLTTIIVSLQFMFWYIWYKVMKINWYFKDYLNWDLKSSWSYALICPWVALFVFWFFFLHLGLVKTWVIDKYWVVYFIFLLFFIYIQFITIRTFFKLNKKMFR